MKISGEERRLLSQLHRRLAPDIGHLIKQSPHLAHDKARASGAWRRPTANASARTERYAVQLEHDPPG